MNLICTERGKGILLKGLLILFASMNLTTVMAQKTDFSGIWKLNKENTDFGDHFSPNSIPIQLIIIQKKDTISIERTSRNKQGETHVYLEKLATDGRTSEVLINEVLKKISGSKWSDDRQTMLEISSTYIEAGQDKQRKASDTWVLSNAGMTLTVSRIDENQDGRFLSKAVYDKQ